MVCESFSSGWYYPKGNSMKANIYKNMVAWATCCRTWKYLPKTHFGDALSLAVCREHFQACLDRLQFYANMYRASKEI